MHFNLKDIITISIAAVGAVLGIINTWHALDQRRVRLRVVPKIAFAPGGEFGETMGCIEVLNLSSFRFPSARSASPSTEIRANIAALQSWNL